LSPEADVAEADELVAGRLDGDVEALADEEDDEEAGRSGVRRPAGSRVAFLRTWMGPSIRAARAGWNGAIGAGTSVRESDET
jgi:hypothetical protein